MKTPHVAKSTTRQFWRCFAWRQSRMVKYEHTEGLAVVFEVETRLIKRYIPSNSDYDVLEVERTDYVPLTGCAHRQLADIRVSYMNT